MKTHLCGLAALTSSLLISLGANAQEVDTCYTNVLGQLMPLTNGDLASCARLIQATRPGPGQISIGQWGKISSKSTRRAMFS